MVVLECCSFIDILGRNVGNFTNLTKEVCMEAGGQGQFLFIEEMHRVLGRHTQELAGVVQS